MPLNRIKLMGLLLKQNGFLQTYFGQQVYSSLLINILKSRKNYKFTRTNTKELWK